MLTKPLHYLVLETDLEGGTLEIDIFTFAVFRWTLQSSTTSLRTVSAMAAGEKRRSLTITASSKKITEHLPTTDDQLTTHVDQLEHYKTLLSLADKWIKCLNRPKRTALAAR